MQHFSVLSIRDGYSIYIYSYHIYYPVFPYHLPVCFPSKFCTSQL